MGPVSDLVRESKLRTALYRDVNGDIITKHVIETSGRSARQRKIRIEQQWRRTESLGEGTFGVVWKEILIAGNSETKERAVKMIRKRIQKSNPMDYSRELEAIAKFSYLKYRSFFVESFGWFDSADAVFITMEFFPNGDLQDYLSKKTTIPEAEVQQITYQVLEGLSFMHHENFAHRDLKPSNILIRDLGPDWWVKIGDFGISKRAEEGMTALRTFSGTPGFLAPEVLAQSGYIDADNLGKGQEYTFAVDIWAMGEITYRALCGEPPFAKSLSAYVKGTLSFPMKPLQTQNISEEGGDLVKQLMFAQPNERLTAPKALEHPWFKDQRDSASRSSGEFPSFESMQSHLPPQLSEESSFAFSEASGRWSTLGDDTVNNLEPPIQGTIRAEQPKTSAPKSSSEQVANKATQPSNENEAKESAPEISPVHDQKATKSVPVDHAPTLKSSSPLQKPPTEEPRPRNPNPNVNNPNSTSFGRSKSTRMPSKKGFDPLTPGGDEAQARSSYRSSYERPMQFPPHGDPLKHFKEQMYESEVPQVPYAEGNRVRTPYSSRAGERTSMYGENVGRSTSVRNSPTHQPSGGRDQRNSYHDPSSNPFAYRFTDDSLSDDGSFPKAPPPQKASFETSTAKGPDAAHSAFKSRSEESINMKFSPSDWQGKFEGNPAYFAPSTGPKPPPHMHVSSNDGDSHPKAPQPQEASFTTLPAKGPAPAHSAFKSRSEESINMKFSPSDWQGKFEGNPAYFTPSTASKNPPLMYVSSSDEDSPLPKAPPPGNQQSNSPSRPRPDDPKFQARRNSVDFKHPQPRQGNTTRHQTHLESQAQNRNANEPERLTSKPSTAPVEDEALDDDTVHFDEWDKQGSSPAPSPKHSGHTTVKRYRVPSYDSGGRKLHTTSHAPKPPHSPSPKSPIPPNRYTTVKREGVPDNDDYSYTDPAGVYRDTEPAWRRPRDKYDDSYSYTDQRSTPHNGARQSAIQNRRQQEQDSFGPYLSDSRQKDEDERARERRLSGISDSALHYLRSTGDEREMNVSSHPSPVAPTFPGSTISRHSSRDFSQQVPPAANSGRNISNPHQPLQPSKKASFSDRMHHLSQAGDVQDAYYTPPSVPSSNAAPNIGSRRRSFGDRYYPEAQYYPQLPRTSQLDGTPQFQPPSSLPQIDPYGQEYLMATHNPPAGDSRPASITRNHSGTNQYSPPRPPTPGSNAQNYYPSNYYPPQRSVSANPSLAATPVPRRVPSAGTIQSDARYYPEPRYYPTLPRQTPSRGAQPARKSSLSQPRKGFDPSLPGNDETQATRLSYYPSAPPPRAPIRMNQHFNSGKGFDPKSPGGDEAQANTSSYNTVYQFADETISRENFRQG